jgi:hypothetical protein
MCEKDVENHFSFSYFFYIIQKFTRDSLISRKLAFSL